MKNLQSIEEGKWVELVSIELTKAEIELSKSIDQNDSDAKKALAEKIATDGKKSISATISSKAKAKYNELKPTVKDGDVYEFISAIFSYDGISITKGIIDCRVNNEHVQIRF
jgi:hypothetical protein